ncbi:serine/threonine protein kinase [Streptomyces cadmiisoli]|uniref:Serine/threonine protein kinase n=1 Tax=Streptomyces cadmiisoli TaxID=2184053 RepID=A0A2Z4J7I4_9ACTN|nr:serine/threonine-protein kinase [Streptomyces cadmiisoli]AWW41185.1 serine/threonine protein kinase [Streptomyces cadmiisoli]
MGKAHVSAHRSVAGRYRLLEAVHHESNRICWYGEDVQAGRPCLVTQVGLPGEPGEESARRAVGRVMRTAETMGQLCPGRVAPVVDVVEEAGSLWTVTEWVGGTPLGELLGQQGPFHYVRAARIGLELLHVLDAAHDQGITHGELSPGQVLVREEGPVVVTGFGLAGATLAPRLTAPSYASPEQARDERIGPAADLWALGAILYTMVEGRPPFRDRDRPETTLKGVDRLPLRTPQRAGPLAQVVQGLLRKNSRERLTRTVAREALTRVLKEDAEAALPAAPTPRLRRAYAFACHASAPGWSRRAMIVGTTLAVVTVGVAILAATVGLSDDEHSATGTQPGPSTTATPPANGSAPSAPAPAPTAPPTASSPSASASATGLPPGFRGYSSPEGFSVALPDGWRPLSTDRVSDLAYRVVLGAEDDPRTLAVTYSERVGTDPVAVWRDDVEPDLKQQADDYRRVGGIQATMYRGREAADMQWLADVDGTRVRTFGRGFLIGDGRGYSLRWTTPADEWEAAENRQALDTFLRTFRPPSD